MKFRIDGLPVPGSMLTKLVVSVFREFLVSWFSLEAGSSVRERNIVVAIEKFQVTRFFVGDYGFLCSLSSFYD